MVDKIKGKKGKKPASPARVAAEATVATAQKANDAAKSPQEKLLAASQLTTARKALKALKFKEIVVPRVNRALKMLEGIEKMANPAAYAWDIEQGKKVAAALTDATDRIADKLAGKGVTKEAFSL